MPLLHLSLFYFTVFATPSAMDTYQCGQPEQIAAVLKAKTKFDNKGYHRSSAKLIAETENLIVNKCITAQNLSLTTEEFNEFTTKIKLRRHDNLQTAISPYYNVNESVSALNTFYKRYPDLESEERGKSELKISAGKARKQDLDSKLKNLPCDTVDLRNESLGEIRHQDSMGWCFGEIAADLLSFKAKKRLSSADITVNYYRNSPKTFFDQKHKNISNGGFVVDAISSAMKTGVCLESDMPHDDFTITKMMDYIENTKNLINTKPTPATCPSTPLSTLTNNISTAISTHREKFISSIPDYFDSIPCKKQNVKYEMVNSPIIKNNDDINGRLNLLETIDSQLNTNNLTAITFDADMFRTKNNVYDGNKHVSTVVARKWNSKTNTCEYLTRGTWGKTFKNPNVNVDDGYVWVSRNEILANVIGTVYLK